MDNNRKNIVQTRSLRAVPGIHISRTVKQKDVYLVAGGKTDYRILLPENPSALEMTAADELSLFFQQATGIALERTITAAAGGKYLSVGATPLLDGAEADFDPAVFGASGFRLLTCGKNILMVGMTGYGTLYAVYEFLRHTFNYEIYSGRTIYIDTGVTDVPLTKFDITEVPDFQYRSPSHAYIKYNETLKNRFRMIDLEDLIKGEGGPYHNSFNYLPPDKYKPEHPGWYSDDGEQLCYTAHGDKSEYEAMVKEAVERIKDVIRTESEAAYIAFTHQDNQEWCTCHACGDAKAGYDGANSGTAVYFLSAVRAELQQWFKTEDGARFDRGQKLVFFAYHGTNKPPVAYNAADESFIVSNDSMRLNGVVPFFAETNGDYTCPLTEGALNKEIANNMRGWKAVSDEILFWTYGTNFESYLTPYNSFDGTQATYKFAAAQGAGLIFDECQINTGASTGWEELKGYLAYRTAWDVNVDTDRLIDGFFRASYGPAAKIMEKVFNDFLKTGRQQNQNGYCGSRSIFINPLRKDYWPKKTLLEWLQLFDEAETRARETADTARREIILRNIALERVSALYLISELYKDEMPAEQLQQYRKRCKSDATACGITMFNEKKKISILWDSWGI